MYTGGENWWKEDKKEERKGGGKKGGCGICGSSSKYADFQVNCSDTKVKVTKEHNDLSIVHLLILLCSKAYSSLDLLMGYVGCKVKCFINTSMS